MGALPCLTQLKLAHLEDVLSVADCHLHLRAHMPLLLQGICMPQLTRLSFHCAALVVHMSRTPAAMEPLIYGKEKKIDADMHNLLQVAMGGNASWLSSQPQSSTTQRSKNDNRYVSSSDAGPPGSAHHSAREHE